MKRFFITAAILLSAISCDKDPSWIYFYEKIEMDSIVVDWRGDNYSIDFAVKDSWEVSTSEEWITCYSYDSHFEHVSYGDEGNYWMMIIINSNDDYSERTGVVTINSGRKKFTIPVTQSGKLSFYLNQTNFIVGREGGLVEIPVMTNVDFHCDISSDISEWVKFSEIKSNNQLEKTLVLDVAENISESKRYAKIDIVPEEESLSSYSIEIEQEGVLPPVSEVTANCYIVSEPGTYSIKTVKGNSSQSVGKVASASVLWESFGTDVAPKRGDLITSAEYIDGVIYFEVPSEFKEGNALIVAMDSNSNILWSWHIWLTDQPKDQEYNNGVGIMMDRNLGATSNEPGDICAFGLLYQWGRKDPFLGSSSKTNNRNKAASLINWRSWDLVYTTAKEGTIANSVLQPTTFITGNDYNGDWFYGTSKSTDNTRWESTKTIYDPCPVGYRVPDGDIKGLWSIAFGIGEDSFNVEYYDSENRGYNFGSINGGLTKDTNCWYPLVACLNSDNAALSYRGNGSGTYWSCTPSSTNYNEAAMFAFYAGDTVSPVASRVRADALSVRCQKE